MMLQWQVRLPQHLLIYPEQTQVTDPAMEEYQRQLEEYNRQMAEYEAWQASQGSQP